MTSLEMKQRKIMQNFRKAETLRKEREAREKAAEAKRVTRLERECHQLRSRPRGIALDAPPDYLKELMAMAGAKASREMAGPIADMFGNPPWAAAIGRMSEALFNGSIPFASVYEHGKVEASIMEYLFDGNHKFSLHIPAVDFNYIIDRQEVQMSRRWR